jgi:hypothetical protein
MEIKFVGKDVRDSLINLLFVTDVVHILVLIKSKSLLTRQYVGTKNSPELRGWHYIRTKKFPQKRAVTKKRNYTTYKYQVPRMMKYKNKKIYVKPCLKYMASDKADILCALSSCDA